MSLLLLHFLSLITPVFFEHPHHLLVAIDEAKDFIPYPFISRLSLLLPLLLLFLFPSSPLSFLCFDCGVHLCPHPHKTVSVFLTNLNKSASSSLLAASSLSLSLSLSPLLPSTYMCMHSQILPSFAESFAHSLTLTI